MRILEFLAIVLVSVVVALYTLCPVPYLRDFYDWIDNA